jgi:dCTP deaminase
MRWAQDGGIIPFNMELVNPASIDLCLADKLIIVEPGSIIDPSNFNFGKHDMTTTRDVKLHYGQHYILQPGSFILASSQEYVNLPADIAGQLLLKSTTARTGIGHAYAGWIDPGFQGTITFELFSHVPITLRPGMRICQLVLYKLDWPASKPYQGRYQAQQGPVSAKQEQQLTMVFAEEELEDGVELTLA